MSAEVEIRALQYNTVAASQPAQTLVKSANSATGAAAGTGARGDILEYLEVTPESTSPGSVTLVDGATSYIVFLGGAGSVNDLKPFTIAWGARSQNAAWQVTTGAAVHLAAMGRFT